MKRLQAALTVLTAIGGMAFLAGCPADLGDYTKAAYEYVDSNSDGICDTCGQGEDFDGDGVCDNFIDEDGDGLCDNRQSHTRLGLGEGGYQFRDGDGDGQCELCCGRELDGDGICDNFIDEDGDGICDNRQSHMRYGLGPHGYQFQDGNGDGQCDQCGQHDQDGDGLCDSFVDLDGDGQCDRGNSHEQHGNSNGHNGSNGNNNANGNG